MAVIKLKSVQLAPGVHIPGLASQTLTSGAGRNLELDLEHGLIALDTGKGEHLIPLTAVTRMDPFSEKYKPVEPPKPAPAPAPVAPGADVVTFSKDPKTGAIVESRKK